MAITSEILLTAGEDGIVLDTSAEYRVGLSMLGAGTPWTLTFWRSTTARSTWDVLTTRVRLGDQVWLAVDGRVQLQGRVEVRRITVDRKGTLLILAGRDLAGPALSWDANPCRSFKGLSLEDALARLFDPLFLSVRVLARGAREATVDALRAPRRSIYARTRRASRVDLVHPHPREKVWQLADRLVRKAGFLIWTAPETEARALGIVVDSPHNDGAASHQLARKVAADGTVTQDSNVLHAEYEAQIRDVPTEVTVFAEAPRGDSDAVRMKRLVANELLIDPAIHQGLLAHQLYPQPLYFASTRARSLEDAQREARRHIADAMAHFRTYRCVVQGHGQDLFGERTLYAINTIVSVRDDVAGIARSDWLVTEVEFAGSKETGQTTSLTMVPRGALVVTPDP